MISEVEYEKRHRELEAKRPAYTKIKKSLDSQVQELFPALMAALHRYSMGDAPEKAVFILAQCQQVAGDVWDNIQKVRNFELQEASLKRLQESSQTPDTGSS